MAGAVAAELRDGDLCASWWEVIIPRAMLCIEAVDGRISGSTSSYGS